MHVECECTQFPRSALSPLSHNRLDNKSTIIPTANSPSTVIMNFSKKAVAEMAASAKAQLNETLQGDLFKILHRGSPTECNEDPSEGGEWNLVKGPRQRRRKPTNNLVQATKTQLRMVRNGSPNAKSPRDFVADMAHNKEDALMALELLEDGTRTVDDGTRTVADGTRTVANSTHTVNDGTGPKGAFDCGLRSTHPHSAVDLLCSEPGSSRSPTMMMGSCVAASRCLCQRMTPRALTTRSLTPRAATTP